MREQDGLGERIVTAARACIGTPFRLRGSDPSHGLDCVGLVAHAFRAVGVPVRLPTGYALRGGDRRDIEKWIGRNGLEQCVADSAQAGDLLLLQPGHRHFHFAVRSDAGFIHADIGLRRIVETPGMPRWSILSVWRCPPSRADREK